MPQLFFSGTQLQLSYQLPGLFIKSQTKPFAAIETVPLDRFSSINTRYSPTLARENRNGNNTKDSQVNTRVLNPVITVPTVVSNIHQDTIFNRYRIGFRIITNNQQQQYILKFITQRQAELIQEIRKRFSLMKKDSDKTNLYGSRINQVRSKIIVRYRKFQMRKPFLVFLFLI